MYDIDTAPALFPNKLNEFLYFLTHTECLFKNKIKLNPIIN